MKPATARSEDLEQHMTPKGGANWFIAPWLWWGLASIAGAITVLCLSHAPTRAWDWLRHRRIHLVVTGIDELESLQDRSENLNEIITQGAWLARSGLPRDFEPDEKDCVVQLRYEEERWGNRRLDGHARVEFVRGPVLTIGFRDGEIDGLQDIRDASGKIVYQRLERTKNAQGHGTDMLSRSEPPWFSQIEICDFLRGH